MLSAGTAGDGLRVDGADVPSVDAFVNCAAGARAEQALHREQRKVGDVSDGMQAVAAVAAEEAGGPIPGSSLTGRGRRKASTSAGEWPTVNRRPGSVRAQAVEASIRFGAVAAAPRTPYNAAARSCTSRARSGASQSHNRSAPATLRTTEFGGRSCTWGVNASAILLSSGSRSGGCWGPSSNRTCTICWLMAVTRLSRGSPDASECLGFLLRTGSSPWAARRTPFAAA